MVVANEAKKETKRGKTVKKSKPAGECRADFGYQFLDNDGVYTDEIKALIPRVDKNFIPFGVYDDLEVIIKSGHFFPTYVYGPTGNGKSSSIRQICAKHQIPLIRVNMNMMTDEDQLIGSKTLVESKDGNTIMGTIYGPVLIAMKNGIPILFDEVDAAAANTILCIQPILEGNPYYFKLTNELIIPKRGFNILATANTKGKGSDDGRYVGTNVLNDAFLERFTVTLEQDYPEKNEEKKVIHTMMNSLDCFNEVYGQNLLNWVEAVRSTFRKDGCDETITTRRLVQIIQTYKMFGEEMKALRLCTNRFDEATKQAFIRLFEFSCTTATEQKERNKRNKIGDMFVGDRVNVK